MEVLVVPADPSDPEGDEVVRKTATLPGERDRLLQEAAVLRAAAERGVAGLARVVAPPAAEAAEPSLVTSAVAGPSLAVAAPLPVLEVAGAVAEVARLLSCLHEAGLVHGSVEASHVVLDGAGGAILVGLGGGGLAGAPSPERPSAPLDPADDVAAWGLLVSQLLDTSATDEEPLALLRTTLASRRVKRAGRRPPARRSDEEERRILAALADQAQDPDPARRPSARSLAAAVTHRVPAARMPGATGVRRPPRPGGGLLERLAAHVAVGPGGPAPGRADESGADPGAGGERQIPPAARRRSSGGRMVTRAVPRRLVPSAGARPTDPGTVHDEAPTLPIRGRAEEAPKDGRPSGWRAGSRRAPLQAAAAVVVLAVLGWSVAARQRDLAPGRPTAAAAPGRPCTSVGPPAADVDGDGCEEPVQWVAGVLQAGSARFAMGGAGDAWALGDWDCDGRRTPALLHAGSLAVFDAWPGPDGELEGRVVATAPDAAGLAVEAGEDGCDRPALRRSGATDLLVDARRKP